MKHLTFYITAFVASMFFAGCQSDNDPKYIEEITLTRSEQSIVKDNVAFSMRLFDKLSEENTDNFVVSPISLGAVLSALGNGADGATKQEIYQALSQSDWSETEINEFYEKMLTSLPKLDKSVELHMANSIWVNEGFNIKDSYKSALDKYFDMDVRTIDFSNSSSVDKINDWCAKQTEKCISSFLNELSASWKAVLLNALYFNAKWTNPFDKKHSDYEVFHATTGDQRANTMFNSGKYKYSETDRFGMVSLPYGNESFAMAVILRDEEGAEFTQEEWESLIQSLSTYTVHLKLPSFSFSNEFDLVNATKLLGITSIFNPQEADFSRLTDEAFGISMLKQKTYISVEESGTKVAAVTGTGGILSNRVHEDYVEFFVDRPFIFVIYEQGTGAILFMGRVNKIY